MIGIWENHLRIAVEKASFQTSALRRKSHGFSFPERAAESADTTTLTASLALLHVPSFTESVLFVEGTATETVLGCGF